MFSKDTSFKNPVCGGLRKKSQWKIEKFSILRAFVFKRFICNDKNVHTGNGVFLKTLSNCGHRIKAIVEDMTRIFVIRESKSRFCLDREIIRSEIRLKLLCNHNKFRHLAAFLWCIWREVFQMRLLTSLRNVRRNEIEGDRRRSKDSRGNVVLLNSPHFSYKNH